MGLEDMTQGLQETGAFLKVAPGVQACPNLPGHLK